MDKLSGILFKMLKMIVAYLFGCIAILSLAFAYQQKKRKKIIINKLIADVCWAIHYSLLGAYGGVIPNAVGILRELTFIKRDEKKWANHIALPIIFILLNLGLGVLTFKNPLNVMPIVASVFVTVSLWLRKPKPTKLITLPVCTTFLIYDALIGSYVGVINEAISIFSIIIDFIKKEYALSVASAPYNTHYVVGDKFNKDGLRVIDQDNNVVESYLLSIANGTTLTEVKDYSVEVSKPGYKSAFFDIHVADKQDKDKVDKSVSIYYIND